MRDCNDCKYVDMETYDEPCASCSADYDKWESPEAVNHPNHYNREDSIECIDEMVIIFGIDKTMDFCLLNVWKYRYRAADKNGIEDMKKSDWYMKKYMELRAYEMQSKRNNNSTEGAESPSGIQ